MQSKPAVEIPETIFDKNRNITYRRGAFLGKGGFAKCYELINVANPSKVFAGKILSKTLLSKGQQREKLKTEIHIHKSLRHENVVQFFECFEDTNFVYIVLELCKNKSLMELHKRRKAITEPEARFFLKQLLSGIQQIHARRIIHRDLKLGNIFLSEDMSVRIGDFGLATQVQHNERKTTICGTPNYIAPEILNKLGHSYEVDIWAVGCILFTFLVGKPPFETQTLKETYTRIKNNNYLIPKSVGPHARALITRLLSPSPDRRPTAMEILGDEFFKVGLLPSKLPGSCLSMTPRFDRRSTIYPSNNSRHPLTEVAHQRLTGNFESGAGDAGKRLQVVDDSPSPKEEITKMYNLLREALRFVKHSPNAVLTADIESPELIPIYWISKWVDYSDKYGLSYQLCDASVGVLFNDDSRITLYDDHETIQFINKEKVETFFTVTVYPAEVQKKVTLLKYFKQYMSEHLVKTGDQVRRQETDVFSRLPFLLSWFRTTKAIILSLSNGTVQMNFFQCHSKLIFCPVMQAVTYIDPEKAFHTIKISDLKQDDAVIPSDLYELLKTAASLKSRLLENIGGKL